MSNKKVTMIVLAVMLVAAAPVLSFADSRGGKGGGCCAKAKESGCMVTDKARMLLKNRDELGLSDEQVARIKELKLQYKKAMIAQQAAIDVVAVDIKAKLYADVIDTEAINALIDKKYEVKTGKAKAMVAAVAELKGLLTAKQRETLKTLYTQCPMGKKSGR